MSILSDPTSLRPPLVWEKVLRVPDGTLGGETSKADAGGRLRLRWDSERLPAQSPRLHAHLPRLGVGGWAPGGGCDFPTWAKERVAASPAPSRAPRHRASREVPLRLARRLPPATWLSTTRRQRPQDNAKFLCSSLTAKEGGRGPIRAGAEGCGTRGSSYCDGDDFPSRSLVRFAELSEAS